MKQKRVHNRTIAGYLFILPATIVVLCVSIYPLLNGFYLSLTSTNSLYPDRAEFVGLKNILDVLFDDPEFWGVIGFTFFFAIGSVICIYVVSLSLSILLNRKFKGKGVFRAIFLLPWIIPSVVAVNSWIWIMNDQFGLINIFLQQIGLIKSPILFLASARNARITAIIVNTWKSFPYMTLVLLAAMQNIDDNLYESAHMDGAGAWKRFIYITLPMIKKISVVSTVLQMIWSFNNFDNVYLLTRGGPGRATMNVSIHTYNTAFYRNRTGYASAIAVVMMVMMFIISTVHRRLLKSDD